MPSDHQNKEPAYLIHRRFDDFDEFCGNAVSWDLDYRQLERGSFDGELLIAGTNRLQFTHARTGRRMIQNGAAPSKMRNFGLLAAQNIKIFWRGRMVTGNDLFVFPVGGELRSVTPSDFDVFVVSLTEETIAAACQALELPDLNKLLKGEEVFRVDPEDLRQLRRLVFSTSNGLKNVVNPINGEGLERFADEITRLVLLALSRGRLHREPRRHKRRVAALRSVEAYLSDRENQVLRLEELCRVTNYSERTLEYAFREYYGLTPKAYIGAFRLNAARKALLLADPAASKVSEIAHTLGFCHMSQFAADYRALFGELPSTTLQRLA